MDTYLIMKEKEIQAICNKIRILRYERGLTQQKVASILDISQNAYNKIENGKTKLLVVTILCLADIFEADVNDFFTDLK